MFGLLKQATARLVKFSNKIAFSYKNLYIKKNHYLTLKTWKMQLQSQR